MGLTAFRNTKHMSEAEMLESKIFGSLLIIIPLLALIYQFGCFGSINSQTNQPPQKQIYIKSIKPLKESKELKQQKNLQPKPKINQIHKFQKCPDKTHPKQTNDSVSLQLDNVSDFVRNLNQNATQQIQVFSKLEGDLHIQSTIQPESEDLPVNQLDTKISSTSSERKLIIIEKQENSIIHNNDETQSKFQSDKLNKTDAYEQSKQQIQNKISSVEDKIKKLNLHYDPLKAIQEAQQIKDESTYRQQKPIRIRYHRLSKSQQKMKQQNVHQLVEKQSQQYQVKQPYQCQATVELAQKIDQNKTVETQTDQGSRTDILDSSNVSISSKERYRKREIDDLIQIDQCGYLTIRSILEIIDYVPNVIQDTNQVYVLENRERRRQKFLSKEISQYLQIVMEYLEKTYELVDEGQQKVVLELGLSYKQYLDSLSIHYNNHLAKDIYTHISLSLQVLRERMPTKNKLLLQDGRNIFDYHLLLLRDGKTNYYLQEIIPLFILTHEQREILFSVLAVIFEDLIWNEFKIEEEEKILFLRQYQSDKYLMNQVYLIEQETTKLINDFMQDIQ